MPPGVSSNRAHVLAQPGLVEGAPSQHSPQIGSQRQLDHGAQCRVRFHGRTAVADWSALVGKKIRIRHRITLSGEIARNFAASNRSGVLSCP
jgi:hypothetical protein